MLTLLHTSQLARLALRKVVLIATTATVAELLALGGSGVVEPARGVVEARTGVGGQTARSAQVGLGEQVG